MLSSAPKRMILSQLDADMASCISKSVLTFVRLCAEVDASNLVLASRLSSPDVLLYFLHLHLLGARGVMDEGLV